MVACTDPAGTTPSASGVFPAQGFTGRLVRVEISGDATDWKDGATISFGDGITVGAVTVASPTDLFADLTISDTAALGLRDVTVTSGGTFTLTKAFKLVAPIEIVFSGDAAQGGIPYFSILNHDFDAQFDATTDSATGKYTNAILTGPTGIKFNITNVSPFAIDGYALIDGDAMPGTVSLASGPTSRQILSNAGAISITTRTPTPFTGTVTTMLPNKGDSRYYSIIALGSPSIVHVALTVRREDRRRGATVETSSARFALRNGGPTWSPFLFSVERSRNDWSDRMRSSVCTDPAVTHRICQKRRVHCAVPCVIPAT